MKEQPVQQSIEALLKTTEVFSQPDGLGLADVPALAIRQFKFIDKVG